jgi:hypothetical protein
MSISPVNKAFIHALCLSPRRLSPILHRQSRHEKYKRQDSNSHKDLSQSLCIHPDACAKGENEGDAVVNHSYANHAFENHVGVAVGEITQG